MTAERNWLASVIRGGQLSRRSNATLLPADLAATAQQEGVTALVDWQIRQPRRGQSFSEVSKIVAQAFATAARDEVLLSMLMEGESRKVLGVLAEEGVPGLLLKGSALAHWAYPESHLRACSDVDILLPSRETAEKLASRLCAAGYERSGTSGELVAYELMCRRKISDEWQLEVDVHWRLANSPLFADAFTFDELMADSISLPRLAASARGLGSVHALLHACVHRALNLSIGLDDKLKWLYDLIVLMDVFTPADWQRVMSISIDKKLAGVVLSGLETAATTFQHELPADILATLKQAAASEPLDSQRLSNWHYMQRKTFEALPTIGLRLRWLWQRVFPSRDYLSYLYGSEQKSYAALMIERFRRTMRRMVN